MKSISELIPSPTLPNKKAPPHEQSAKVELILGVGESKLPYGAWLGKVKKHSYAEVHELVETAKGLEDKYNKMGFIWKRL